MDTTNTHPDRSEIYSVYTACEDTDIVTIHACKLLLGNQPVITIHVQWEERYGGGGHFEDERQAIIGMDEAKAATIVRDYYLHEMNDERSP